MGLFDEIGRSIGGFVLIGLGILIAFAGVFSLFLDSHMFVSGALIVIGFAIGIAGRRRI